MNILKMVLPFRWRDFGVWFSRNSSVRSENEHGALKIEDLYFSNSRHNLNGIKISRTQTFATRPGSSFSLRFSCRHESFAAFRAVYR